jgi:DNA-binding winged helix-turn-helix (wHTH) protein
MGSEAAAAFVFDLCLLQLDRGTLLAEGVECALRPKSFTLLRHFVENPGRLIAHVQPASRQRLGPYR